MFTFSEQEYKWCVECQGNIRKDAYYCKFCRKPVGSKLLAAKAPRNVSGLITTAAQWLPNFDRLLDVMPAPFRARIEKEDEATPPPHIGLKPGIDPNDARKHDRNSGICPPHHPQKAAFGLIVDVLISLCAQDLSLSEICADPRLQLLELSVGEVVAEYELRLSEIEGGYKCTRCAEFVANDCERCRFCTGSEKELPQPGEDDLLSDINRFDASLLRNVLLWEAATRRINSEPELNAEILSKQAITENDIDAQILKLRQNPALMPLSRWRERMVQLGISPGYFEEDQAMHFHCDFEHFSLDDITALARALTPDFHRSKEANGELALIVVEHGLTRWQSSRYYEREKHSLVSAKAMVYMSLKDDENYKKFDKEAKDILMKSLPDDYKGMIGSQLEDFTESPLTTDLNASPEEQLKSLEDKSSKFLKMRTERMEKMNDLIPGLADILKGMGDYTSRMVEIGKHNLKGQAALKKEDAKTACAEFEAAIALVGDNAFDINQKCNLLLNLAGAQFINGDAKAAEVTFQRALSDAADLVEAESDMNPLGQVHHRYACFLRDTKNYAEAEEHFNKAAVEHAEMISSYIAKGYMAADYCKESWRIKEDLAKLLRAMGRDEEAETAENEIKILKEKNPIE